MICGTQDGWAAPAYSPSPLPPSLPPQCTVQRCFSTLRHFLSEALVDGRSAASFLYWRRSIIVDRLWSLTVKPTGPVMGLSSWWRLGMFRETFTSMLTPQQFFFVCFFLNTLDNKSNWRQTGKLRNTETLKSFDHMFFSPRRGTAINYMNKTWAKQLNQGIRMRLIHCSRSYS